MHEIVKVVSSSISKWSAVHRFKAKRFNTLSISYHNLNESRRQIDVSTRCSIFKFVNRLFYRHFFSRIVNIVVLKFALTVNDAYDKSEDHPRHLESGVPPSLPPHYNVVSWGKKTCSPGYLQSLKS